MGLHTKNLVQNQRSPAEGAVNPIAPVFGADFTPEGKPYSGGSFSPRSGLRRPEHRRQVGGPGRGGQQDQHGVRHPDLHTITSFPQTFLDQANGKIAVAYYNAAGIPQFASTTSQDLTQAAYVFGTPLSLNQCNDVYVLSHADPSLWPASYKTALINFVDNGGWLYQGCHSVSELDVNVPTSSARA